MDKVQQKAEAMKETRDGSHKMVNVVRTGLWLIAVRKRETVSSLMSTVLCTFLGSNQFFISSETGRLKRYAQEEHENGAKAKMAGNAGKEDREGRGCSNPFDSFTSEKESKDFGHSF